MCRQVLMDLNAQKFIFCSLVRGNIVWASVHKIFFLPLMQVLNGKNHPYHQTYLCLNTDLEC